MTWMKKQHNVTQRKMTFYISIRKKKANCSFFLGKKSQEAQ